MTIGEIANLLDATGFSPVTPYVYMIMPGGLVLADFWINTFGAPDESRDFSITVRSFIRAFNVKYNEFDSFDDCVAQEGSFFWDGFNQKLYIHFEHNQEGLTDFYQYGTFFGFSDTGVVYIDDQEYSPLILSVPSFSQQQDIVNYDKLAFVGGSIRLNNRTSVLSGKVSGQLDDFITADIYRNDIFLYYLDDKLVSSLNNASRSDLIPLSALYVKDYEINLQEIDIRIQDPRKAQNISVPNETFNSTDYPDIGEAAGDVIPLMYGNVRESKAVNTNGETVSGDVEFRVAVLLTVLGTVQVDIDGIWTTVVPSGTAISTGEFTLSSANGRNTNGSIRDCRVLEPTGIVITYTSDIIIDLNLRYLGVEFLDSNYDTAEWASEETSLSSGGWVYDESIKLFDAIRIIQNGSIKGFRYEINASGQRTIRIDDPDRTPSGRIQPEDILNRDTMPVSTDSDLVFSEIKVKYDKSFNSGRSLSVENNSFSVSVLKRYKELSTLTRETMLNNSTDADSKARDDAERFSTVPEIMTLDLMGKEFLNIRILDTYDIEATPDFADADNDVIVGREYYGFQRAQVISISPDSRKLTNSVSFLLFGVPEILFDGGDFTTDYDYYDGGDFTTDYDYYDGGAL